MTDFDYEILETVAKHGENGVTQAELESGKFKGYDIGYHLRMLSYREPIDVNGLKILTDNDAVLLAREENKRVIDDMMAVLNYRYFITHRGQALLNNWKMCNKRRSRRHHFECLCYAFLGALAGIFLSPPIAPTATYLWHELSLLLQAVCQMLQKLLS